MYSDAIYRNLKNYQCSTEGQKFHQNLAPVLVIISWNSLVFFHYARGDGLFAPRAFFLKLGWSQASESPVENT